MILLGGCSATKFIPEGSYMLDNVTVKSTDKRIKTGALKGYVRQHPNSRWFSLLKVPMGPYALSGRDSTRRINRFLKRIGEAPVVYDSVQAQRARDDMQAAVRNQGYLQADVALQKKSKRKKLKLTYVITPGERYHVRNIRYHLDDAQVAAIYQADTSASLLREGMPFDINVLDAERTRVNTLMLNNGFYKFNKEFVKYEADTTVGERQVDLTLQVPLYRKSVRDTLAPHRTYHLRHVTFLNDVDLAAVKQKAPGVECSQYDGFTMYYKNKLSLRRRLIAERTWLESGALYRERDVQATYSNFARLGAVLSSAIKMQEAGHTNDSLDCYISLATNKRHSFNTEVEGTNSAGDLGAALSVSYQNRNIFRGSELFNLKLRGAFEAITGLEGYSDQNYVEMSAEASLAFPGFKIPFLSRNYRRAIRATSEVSVMYDSQNRPEFHRRVLTGTFRYRWNRLSRQLQNRFDLIDLNYVFMPWVSETFKKDYLDDSSNRNAILRYNYENLFIMRMGYTFSYSSRPGATAGSSYGTNAVAIRLNVESAGNLLYGMSSLFHTNKNGENQYTLMNIAYAQYVKGDFDISKSFRFDERNSLALHLGVGIAYPYGNSTILPYEKRYFSGGANSVRGWSVRELGPGSYTGTDGRIDFINQTGDIKLDMNAEYRTFLFWKIHGAVFVDAGNIWTIRSYEEQPGGQFRFNTFWRQIAVAYGLGFRLNFGYFILRLDGGMKAINPAFSSGEQHYPLIHPSFKRDFTFHFAVGLPF